MKIKVLKCEEMSFNDKNGQKTTMYKVQGLLNGNGLTDEIIQVYNMKPVESTFEYECEFRVKDMKEIKLVITNMIKDTNKGIFNK